jgi:cytochrome oxidase Cu insertion factor (SCO1/SenC/PrrC family)
MHAPCVLCFQEVDHEDDNDDYLVDHSIVAYLMSPEGEFLDFYTQLLTAGEVAERMAATIIKHEKK